MADWDPTDASVVVAGATGGLGSRIAALLADAGAKVTLVSRSAERLDELDVEGHRVEADLTLPGEAARALDEAVETHGGLDAVVNATGVVAFGDVASLETDTLEQLFLVNTFLPVMLTQAALDRFGDDGGLLVNISGVIAAQPMPQMAAYSASKGALAAFATALRKETRKAGVEVLDVQPPHTETELSRHPIAGEAPTLPDGASPDDVAQRIVTAMREGERHVSADGFQ